MRPEPTQARRRRCWRSSAWPPGLRTACYERLRSAGARALLSVGSLLHWPSGWGLAAAAAAEPLERFEAFRRAPTSSPTTIESHLLNVSSTGRWQQWEAAVAQFHSAPLHGGGAGSYGSWWLQHGSLGGFVTEAHSLYLEVLGELGLVGFALLGLALGFAVFGSVRQTLRARDRQILSGLTAAAGAYLVAMAIDWMWELTVVSVVGVACLGLAGGTREGSSPRRSTPRWTRAALTLVAVLAIAIQTIPFLTHVKLRESQEASARGDLAHGRSGSRRGGDDAAVGRLTSSPTRTRKRARGQSAGGGTAAGRGAAVGLRRLAPLARGDAAPREAGRDRRGAVERLPRRVG